MKYIEAIEKLKQGWQLRYYNDGTISGETVDIGDPDWNDVEQLHPRTIEKIFRAFEYEYRPCAIEGNEETGWIIINFNRAKNTITK